MESLTTDLLDATFILLQIEGGSYIAYTFMLLGYQPSRQVTSRPGGSRPTAPDL